MQGSEGEETDECVLRYPGFKIMVGHLREISMVSEDTGEESQTMGIDMSNSNMQRINETMVRAPEVSWW